MGFLHSMPRNFLLIFSSASMITLIARNSTVRPRSEFAMRPLRLSWEATYLLISYDNFTLHNTGYISIDRDNHTPTAKYDAASWYTMNIGGSGVIQFTGVVHLDILPRRL